MNVQLSQFMCEYRAESYSLIDKTNTFLSVLFFNMFKIQDFLIPIIIIRLPTESQ